MKISIVISALILAAAAGIGWKIEGRLAAARSDERRLAAEAAGFGLTWVDGHPIRTIKRERMDRQEIARKLAVELIAEASIRESVRSLDSAVQNRNKDLRQKLEALDPSQLLSIIRDVLESKDLSERIRAEQAVGLLGILAGKDPRGALALFVEYYSMITMAPRAKSVISDSLGSWAKDDPVAAVKWMTENPEALPEELIKSSRGNVLNSVAEKDPRLAFKLAAGFDVGASNTLAALHSIVTAAATDEGRNATVAALREYLGAHTNDPMARDQIDRSFGYLSWAFKPDGLEAASSWIAGANLSPLELESFCAGLSISAEVNDPGRWIEWMGTVFPPGVGEDQMISLISRWTRDDYEATGKWLGSIAEGPVKTAAIRGYAETVSKFEPETAAQWALTLPAGKDRDQTLLTIYQNWAGDDVAKQAFAKDHGIK